METILEKVEKQKEEALKRSKGITLIALVVTIIVLLILAGVAIATLTGEDGVLTKVASAKEKTERAEVIENAKLDITAMQIDKEGKLTTGDLKEVLDKYFKDVPEEITEEDIATLELTTKDEKYEIKLSEVYNGKLAEASKSKTIADLYDGINDPKNANYKETGMHIGDYVDYTAGSWSEEKAAPTEDFTFGGYTAGQSRDTSATGGDMGSGYGYSGWRIWDISEDKQTMTLISAGCPEIYYHPYGYAYNTEKILTGATTGTIDTSKPSTPRVWADYVNATKYANSARAMKESDLDIWYGKYIDSSISGTWDIDSFPLNADNKLISIVENGYYYWLPTASTWDQVSRVDYDRRRVYDVFNGSYGVRLLVSLTSEVKFGETPEKVEHDGFSYNKWIIK